MQIQLPELETTNKVSIPKFKVPESSQSKFQILGNGLLRKATNQLCGNARPHVKQVVRLLPTARSITLSSLCNILN